VGVFIVVEAVRRRVDPGEIASTALIVFGLVGLVGNIVSIGILAGVRAPT
jgi:cobalt-zinc-cadmium efflux system protein